MTVTIPITVETLGTVRALTAWVLLRERATQSGSHAPSAPEALRQQLAAIPLEMLIQAIRRHRLESMLHADPAVSDLVPNLGDELLRAARSEAMAALGLASLTREMASLFAEAAIPLLVMKGIPLALQTTGSLTSRGRGDCDLFVDPSQVGEAIALLQSAGFVLSDGASCVGEDSFRGRYSRFVSIEISLHRDAGGRRQWIDLHWHAAHALGLLPGFQELWRRRETVYINDQLIWTFSQCDAFVHGCCHATSDRWMLLRNLVDLERLAIELPSTEMVRIQKQRLVRKSFAVLLDCGFLDDSVLRFSLLASVSTNSSVVRLARRTQLSVDRTSENLLIYGLRYLNMSWTPLNWLAKMLLMIAPPDVLIKRSNGKPLSFFRIVIARIEKLIYQVSIRNTSLRHFRNSRDQL